MTKKTAATRRRAGAVLFGRWRDGEGNVEEVRMPSASVSQVVRTTGFAAPGSLACEVTDTGNGFIVKFPPHRVTEQDYYLCFDYDQARSLVLGLAPHQEALGFKGDKT